MRAMSDRGEWEEQLDSFDATERREALGRLAAEHGDALGPEGTNVNLHFHSFFSYNAEGYSPSHIAWEARKAGLYAAGLCDFDVLDGLEEFFEAGFTVGLRTTVHVETRVYLKEYAGVDISSPGEPGVTYIMGAGFAGAPAEGTAQARELRGYRSRARERNIALVNRINGHLPDIALDYERDVLPLTPAGTATERHIIEAYVNRARTVFAHPEQTAGFWSRVLDRDREETVALMADRPALEEAVRARLVKRGGLGYEQPSPETFPPAEEFIAWVRSCGAIPMIAWLDGTSPGEEDTHALLSCLTGKGAAAVNMIPDRNWNVADPDTRRRKLAKLAEVVQAASELGLPLNVGTEMNKKGLPFVDDLAVDALRPYRDVFLRGARILVGHSLLLRFAGVSYVGEWAQAEFQSVAAKNDFFESVGGLPPLGSRVARELEQSGRDAAWAWFRDAAGRRGT